MKFSVEKSRTPAPNVLAAIIITTLVVSAVWFFPFAGTVHSLKSKLTATEKARLSAEVRASERIAERQRAYLKTLSATLLELERLRAAIEKAESRGETFESRPLPPFSARSEEETQPEPEPQPSVAMKGSAAVSPEVSAKLTLAENYLKARRFYKALEVAKEIDALDADFTGSEYIRFQVNKEMGFLELAARSAELIIKAAPEDARTKPQYLYLIDYYSSSDQKQRADEVFAEALKLWPEVDTLRREFKTRFGYEPALTAAEIPL